ncbi:MAG: GNAT family N-acetyltransferase [Saprospiraceae bacterium]
MNTLKITDSEDFSTIERLARSIWQDHYVSMIGQAQVDYMLEKFYRIDALNAQHQEGQAFWLIEIEGEPCGYIGISEKEKGAFFLHKFYLNTNLQGKGFGKKIFDLLLSQYPGAESIRLQVNINNFKSINFYFKLGFTIEKRFILNIGNGYIMDDYIMLWKNKI